MKSGIACSTLFFAFMSPVVVQAQDAWEDEDVVLVEEEEQWAPVDSLPQNIFTYSPIGPGRGHDVLSLGGRLFFILPMVDARYMYGLSDRTDVSLHLSTIGTESIFDFGGKVRLFGDAASGFSMALKGSGELWFAFKDNGGIVAAATPGLVLGVGDESIQFSLSADFPMFFANAGFRGGFGGALTQFAPFFRPVAAIEFPIGKDVNLFVEASAYMLLTPFRAYAPILVVGAAW